MLTVAEQTDFSTYISAFKDKLAHLFNAEFDYNSLSLKRDLPSDLWKEIMSMQPLSVAIPKIYGGRGVLVKECLGVLSAASYESLSLSLTFGINIALFLEPLAKYGSDTIKYGIFNKFLDHGAMGGLMITEPGYGSDALNMQTCYKQNDDHYHIQGQKHWQGLTGAADFWLVTARKKNENGDLTRDIDFFVTDNAQEDQKIVVEKRYNNLGLYAIPYGVNNLDLQVPVDQKLVPGTTGIKLMLDTLHRSRLQFPGMGMGFIKRMLDESMKHCHDRRVSGLRLNEIDAIKFQLSRLQSSFTICSGMCSYSTQVSSIEHELSGVGIEANSVKALVTDLMHESAQICLQLSGANGYRLDHIAGRSVVDSRPFQIFEGSNEMLYSQIAEAIAKLMRKSKEKNLLEFLKTYKSTNLAAPIFASLLNFNLTDELKQRDMVTLGRIIARVISFQFTISLSNAGFNAQLIEITREHMQMDISMYIGQLTSNQQADPTAYYHENSDWLDLLVD